MEVYNEYEFIELLESISKIVFQSYNIHKNLFSIGYKRNWISSTNDLSIFISALNVQIHYQDHYRLLSLIQNVDE